MQMVSAVCAADASLTPIGAALFVAVSAGIAKDTRTFARTLGLAHALVLREVASLSGNGGLLAVTGRNERTQRTELSLTDEGAQLAIRSGLPRS
jgi:hypothetical protein